MAIVFRRSAVRTLRGFLGDYPPTALGQAALDILSHLPPGSGVNPIGVDPSYPFPHDPPQDNVVDPNGFGNRYVDWYNAHPVLDVSGLIEWNGPGGAQLVGGLSAAQALAARVLIEGGDSSWSADIHPQSAAQAAKPMVSNDPVTTDPQHYVPTTWQPTGDHPIIPPDLLTHPNQTAAGPPAPQPPPPPVVTRGPDVAPSGADPVLLPSPSSHPSDQFTIANTGSSMPIVSPSTPFAPNYGGGYGGDGNSPSRSGVSGANDGGGMFGNVSPIALGLGALAALAFAFSRKGKR